MVLNLCDAYRARKAAAEAARRSEMRELMRRLPYELEEGDDLGAKALKELLVQLERWQEAMAS